jgi:hypothetical protein
MTLEELTIEGAEMTPGELVHISVEDPSGTQIAASDVTADGEGKFTESYRVPVESPQGIYTMRATGSQSGKEMSNTFDWQGHDENAAEVAAEERRPNVEELPGGGTRITG